MTADAPKTRLDYLAVVLETVTAFLIGCAVAGAWRGAWVVLDATLWPEDTLASAGLGLGIGGAMFVALVAIQPLLAAHCLAYRPIAAGTEPDHDPVATVSNSRRYLAVFLDLVYSYAGFWCSVLTWRGAWQLWDHALDVGLPAGPTDHFLARGGWFSHRGLNAPPVLNSADWVTPLYGARSTPGIGKYVPWFRRLSPSAPLPQMTREQWHDAVGLPLTATSV
eukprot:TRINITY_DN7529_c1_g1_i2.p1 TRINITY_DN7529_c1_g1~~TRINITY_DN7529_c1_g1_i2.p1  ORF type:complete len:236 (+),score=52.36 TRINITY_DN7529_c1_g1_i2:43-708(+)